MKELVKSILGKEQRIISYSSPEDSLLRRILINSIEISTGRNGVEEIYKRLKALNIDDITVWQHVFPVLDIKLDYNRNALDSIEKNSPLVVIANHPFGVADGLVLGYILSELGSDFYLVVNEVLCREPILGRYFLPIDFRNSKTAIATNLQTRKMAMDHLLNGGNIGIFPSGGVSTTPKIWKKKADDLDWKRFVVKIIRKTGATVLPIYFPGQNSRRFQVASHVHPNLRLALLLSELNRKRGDVLSFKIGEVIRPHEIKDIPRDRLLDFLKNRTFELQVS